LNIARTKECNASSPTLNENYERAWYKLTRTTHGRQEARRRRMPQATGRHARLSSSYRGGLYIGSRLYI
jgi:hypothetical protein